MEIGTAAWNAGGRSRPAGTAPRKMKDNRDNLIDFAGGMAFEDILSNPILDIAARFWDEERYEAFRVCYRSMRRIDDLVDETKEAGAAVTPEESARLKETISRWIDSVKKGRGEGEFDLKFKDIAARYRIPFWPWDRLSAAMSYDLDHDGYLSFRVFLRYCEGAAVAPASVFVHLCGLAPDNGGFLPPAYDIRKAARPLAIFSYIAHILRDFRKDCLKGLNCFAEDLLSRRSLTRSDLRSIAEGGRIDGNFRALIADYIGIAHYYEKMALETFDWILPRLESRYQLSLMMIHALYLQIIERINAESGSFTEEETTPSKAEMMERIKLTVSSFNPA